MFGKSTFHRFVLTLALRTQQRCSPEERRKGRGEGASRRRGLSRSTIYLIPFSTV